MHTENNHKRWKYQRSICDRHKISDDLHRQKWQDILLSSTLQQPHWHSDVHRHAISLQNTFRNAVVTSFPKRGKQVRKNHHITDEAFQTVLQKKAASEQWQFYSRRLALRGLLFVLHAWRQATHRDFEPAQDGYLATTEYFTISACYMVWRNFRAAAYISVTAISESSKKLVEAKAETLEATAIHKPPQFIWEELRFFRSAKPTKRLKTSMKPTCKLLLEDGSYATTFSDMQKARQRQLWLQGMGTRHQFYSVSY